MIYFLGGNKKIKCLSMNSGLEISDPFCVPDSHREIDLHVYIIMDLFLFGIALRFLHLA